MPSIWSFQTGSTQRSVSGACRELAEAPRSVLHLMQDGGRVANVHAHVHTCVHVLPLEHTHMDGRTCEQTCMHAQERMRLDTDRASATEAHLQAQLKMLQSTLDRETSKR